VRLLSLQMLSVLRFRHRLPRASFAPAVFCAATLLAVSSAPAAAAPYRSSAVVASAVSASAVTALASDLELDSTVDGPYVDGVWENSNTLCWECNEGGPATAAATVWLLTGRSDARLLDEAVATVDTVIDTRQLPDGSFASDSGAASRDIATMFWGVEMGTTYLEVEHALDGATRARWQRSLAAAASYLIANGNPSWYTNGNIDLGNAELFYLVYRATGDRRYLAAYNTQWNTLVDPNQDRWPGAGLVITKTPTSPDDSDGAGYLAEIGAGGTGFDAEYAELQLDVASRLYVVSGDHRALQLMNLLLNQLLPRVSPSWRLSTDSGSRHTEPARTVPFLTSALVVLARHTGRANLAGLATSQFAASAAQYANPANADAAVFRRGLGNDLSTIALSALTDAPRQLGGCAPPNLGGTSLGSASVRP
jgi:hypothetical protein